ncbi:MAG: OB-fold nucleic acid binding domain-containing protein [Candidatus Woesearchaeota archaeon]
MQIKDLQPKQGNVDITLDITEVTEPREFQKFGKVGRVATATAKDETGTVKLSLWNEDIDKVRQGMKVNITNGYVNEYQGEMQLTTGKFGKLEIMEEGQEPEHESKPEELKPEEPADEADIDVEEEDVR